jgi:hypothetical protein
VKILKLFFLSSSSLGPNIFLSNLFSNILNLCAAPLNNLIIKEKEPVCVSWKVPVL